jgi:e3 binding domain
MCQLEKYTPVTPQLLHKLQKMIIFQLVCIIVESQDEVAAFKNFVDDGAAAPAAAAKPAAPAPAAAAPAPPPPTPIAVPVAAAPVSVSASQSGQVLASPLARKLAAEQGLDLSVSLSIAYSPIKIALFNLADNWPRFGCLWFDHCRRPFSGVRS